MEDIMNLVNEHIKAQCEQKEKALKTYIANGGKIEDIEIEQYPSEVKKISATSFMLTSIIKIVNKEEL